MTAIADEEHQIQHVTAELEGLQRLLPLLVKNWARLLLLMLRIGNIWAALKMLEQDVKAMPDNQLIDPDGRLDEGLLRLAVKVGDLARQTDQLGVRNLRIRLLRFLAPTHPGWGVGRQGWLMLLN